MKSLKQIKVSQVVTRILTELETTNIQLAAAFTRAESGEWPVAKARRAGEALLQRGLRYNKWVEAILTYYDCFKEEAFYKELDRWHAVMNELLYDFIPKFE